MMVNYFFLFFAVARVPVNYGESQNEQVPRFEYGLIKDDYRGFEGLQLLTVGFRGPSVALLSRYTATGTTAHA